MGLPSYTGVARLDNPQHLRTHSDILLRAGYLARPSGSDADRSACAMNTTLRRWTPQDRANLYDPATQSLVQVGTNGIPRGGYLPDRNNFAPRAGPRLDARGRRNTVLRAGYGIYYDQSSLATGEGLYFNPPYFDFKLYFPARAGRRCC